MNMTNQKEWYFEISDNIDIQTTPGGGFNLNIDMLKQIGGILCIGAAVIFIPWMLFIFVRRLLRNKKNNAEANVVNFETTTDSVEPYPYQIANNDYSKFDAPGELVIDPVAAAPMSNFQPMGDNTGAIEMPASYSTDEIPDWLKDVNSSQAVGVGGGDYKPKEEEGKMNVDESISAMPHDS